MITLISTPVVADKFQKELSGIIALDKWLTPKTIPYKKHDIISLTKRNGVDKGDVIILAKYGKRNPSHFPEICTEKLLVSLVFYKTHNDISNWLNAIKANAAIKSKKVFVLAMMKPFYMKWGEKIYNCLSKKRYGKGKVFKHLADTTTNVELAQKLSKGCSLAIYVGHGRSRGWSGYRGFRWKHVEKFKQKTPNGSMISLSCSSLKHDKKYSLPLGLQYVMEGRMCTFIGTWDSVKIKPLQAITSIFLDLMSDSKIKEVGELLINMNKRVKELNNPDVLLNWSKFRLIGNPFQPL